MSEQQINKATMSAEPVEAPAAIAAPVEAAPEALEEASAEAPAEEAPAEEALAEAEPVAEVPAEAPAAEALEEAEPVAEIPVEAPAEALAEAPAEEAPAEEALAEVEPVAEIPVEVPEEAPAEAPAEEALEEVEPVAEVPVETPEEAPAEAPAEEALAEAEPVAELSAEAATPQADHATAHTGDQLDDNGQPVVRMLSVGQQVKGIVKRITEFGAFVDIGVGRDGLVHISELSAKRVGKVSDVLQDGQEIQLWIKKLDRERNRISLTMIEPGKRTIRDLQKGEVVEGTVTRLLPYGAFIDIGIGRDALLHVREMAEGFVAKPEDVVQIGQTVEVRVIEIARRRSRVDLSMKGLRPEPEASAQPQSGQPEQAAPEGQPGQPERQDRGNQGRGDQGRGDQGRGDQGRGDQGRSNREQQFQRYQGGGRGRFDQPGRGDQQGRGDRRGRQPEPEPVIEMDPNDEFADMEVLTPMQLAFKRAQEKSGVVLPTAKGGKGNQRQDSTKKRAQQEDIIERTLTSGGRKG